VSEATNTSMPSPSMSAKPVGSKATSSVASGAAKVFREFKWGLLTLFLLMVVVIGLVYDGGKKKTAETAKAKTEATKDWPASSPPESSGTLGGNDAPPPYDPAPNPAPGAGLPTPSGPTTPPRLPTGPSITPRSGGTTPTHTETHPTATHGTAATDAAANSYTVKSGDKLSLIASKFYPGHTQTGIQSILDANKDQLSDANTLKVGMILKIPASAPAANVAAHGTDVATGDAAKPGEGSFYVVQSGDTLERIARKLYSDGSRWRELFEMNKDTLSDPHNLRVGMKLRTAKGGATAGKHDAKVVEDGGSEVHPATQTAQGGTDPQMMARPELMP